MSESLNAYRRGERSVVVPPTPHVTKEEACAKGFATFNRMPHLCVDVPDGGFTITARTSEGKRATFCFLHYRDGGPPRCIDIAYHDEGTTSTTSGKASPTFETIVHAAESRQPYNSRNETDPQRKPGIVTILMDDPEDKA